MTTETKVTHTPGHTLKLNSKEAGRTLHITWAGTYYILTERERIPNATGARSHRWEESRITLDRPEAAKLMEFLAEIPHECGSSKCFTSPCTACDMSPAKGGAA